MRKSKDAEPKAVPPNRFAQPTLKPIPSPRECVGFVTCSLKGLPLSGASIFINAGSFFIGTSTADDGIFKVSIDWAHVKGHHIAEINCLGYKKKLIPIKDLLTKRSIELVKDDIPFRPETIEWVED